MKRWLIPLTVFLVACSAMGSKGPSETSLERRVDGNRILIGDHPYAELIYICEDKPRNRYKGLAIHYAYGNQFEWISPKKGWTIIKEGRKVSDIKSLKEI